MEFTKCVKLYWLIGVCKWLKGQLCVSSMSVLISLYIFHLFVSNISL